MRADPPVMPRASPAPALCPACARRRRLCSRPVFWRAPARVPCLNACRRVRRELDMPLCERGRRASDADCPALARSGHRGKGAGLSESPLRARHRCSAPDWVPASEIKAPLSERKHSKWVDQWYTRDAHEVRRNRFAETGLANGQSAASSGPAPLARQSLHGWATRAR